MLSRCVNYNSANAWFLVFQSDIMRDLVQSRLVVGLADSLAEFIDSSRVLCLLLKVSDVMRERGELSGVIFDMDGVLIDSEPLHFASTIKYLNDELGLSYDEEENREFLGRSDEYMFRVLRQRYEPPFSVHEMIARRRDIYLDLLVGNVKLTPGVAALIRRLKSVGYKMAVASSSLEKIIETVVTEGGIKEYFDVLQSGEHLTNCKPHPEIFLLTAGKMRIKPELCAVIEDTTVGIQAARAAGMLAIAYDAPDTPKQDFSEADVVFRSFADVELREVL